MNFKWPLFFVATPQQREALNLQTMKQQAKKGTKNKKYIIHSAISHHCSFCMPQ
jgi:hypothetical protein